MIFLVIASVSKTQARQSLLLLLSSLRRQESIEIIYIDPRLSE